MATLIRSAHEEYESYQTSNSVISLYYASFKLIQALIVSISRTKTSLEDIQNSSRYGHGVKMDLKNRGHFPSGVYFWYTPNGMMSDLLEERELSSSIFQGPNRRRDQIIRTTNFQNLIDHNIFRVNDLLRRIPELDSYIGDLRVGVPLYLNTGQPENVTEPAGTAYSQHEAFSKYKRSTIKRELAKYRDRASVIYTDENSHYEIGLLQDKVSYYKGRLRYISDWPAGHPESYWIIKMGEIGDMLIIYFSLLYILSIIIRYYPAEWSKMISDNSSLLPLIEAFKQLSLNAIPAWICDEIYGKQVIV